MKIKRVMGINALCKKGDYEAVIKLFEDVLGANLGPDMPHLAQFGHRARIAWIGTEMKIPFSLEISESINDELPIGKQHARSAPTFQFIGLEVENLDEAIAEVRAKGIRISDKAVIKDPEWEYLWESMIHPKDSFGLLIELIEGKKKAPATAKKAKTNK